MTALTSSFEYGIRIDAECRQLIWEQIHLSRQLYNELVAAMRSIHQEMQDFTIEQAGDVAQLLLVRINQLNEQFKVAKAANDDAALKVIAQERRDCWTKLSPILKDTRKANKATIQERFLSQIGLNSATRTYAIRCLYVEKGLGWATSNNVLDRALTAWKKRFALGKAPDFARAADKRQDTLTLQFTAAGGLPVDMILGGKSKELSIHKDGEFYFRLGAAKSDAYATGLINLHRPLPSGCQIPGARLICERVANQERYRLQLVVVQEADIHPSDPEKPVLAVHLGWAFDVSGRRIAGINDTNDPSTAQMIQLPADIESDLERAAQMQAKRDKSRDDIHPLLKTWALTGDEGIDTEIKAIQRLPAQYIDQARLHRLLDKCWRAGHLEPSFMITWRKQDKKDWQAEVGIARHARNRRKNFYTELARSWVKQYSAIAIQPLDLKEAAVKLNEKTGERGEFTKKARAGQRVAALYEFISILKWQAKKAGVAVFEENLKSVDICATCGEETTRESQEDWQVLECTACGAVHDRKINGASVFYQLVSVDAEQRTAHYHAEEAHKENERLLKKTDRLFKMQEARRKARTASDAKNSGDSRTKGIAA